MTDRLATWCAGSHPVCPACGGRLWVAVDEGRVRGRCGNRANGQGCKQHWVAVGLGFGVTLVVALSPEEFHALGAGRLVAGLLPEGVTCRAG